MHYKRIPVLFKPSKVVLVDDNLDFLNGFRLFLPDYVSAEIFRNPFDALDYLNGENAKRKPFENKILEVIESDPELPRNDLLRNIHQVIFDSGRFDETTVLVTDYSMPGMSGIDLCKQIENPIIKKLILTGELGNEMALDAFNTGILDKFLHKSSMDIYDKLLNFVYELQWAYHVHLSEKILNALLRSELPILKNPQYVDLFKTIFKEFQILEFYLVDTSGSFLLIDRWGNLSFLAVKSRKDLDDWLSFANGFEWANSLKDDLQKGKCIPFFFAAEDFTKSPEHWNDCIYPAKPLQGASDIFYSIIRQPKAELLEKSGLSKFQKFQAAEQD